MVVFDYDGFSRDDYVGEVVLPLALLRDGAAHHEWLQLQARYLVITRMASGYSCRRALRGVVARTLTNSRVHLAACACAQHVGVRIPHNNPCAPLPPPSPPLARRRRDTRHR